MGNRSAQSSVEFLLSWGLILLLFTVLMGIYIGKAGDFNRTAGRVEAEKISEEIASSANAVYSAGAGARSAVWLKEGMPSGENYTIRFVGNRVEVNWSGGFSESPLVFSNINGTGNATGFFRNSFLNFTNIGGGIVLVSQ